MEDSTQGKCQKTKSKANLSKQWIEHPHNLETVSHFGSLE
jgi:hypothetical protein